IYGLPGRKVNPAIYDSLNDHRIAMSAAILAMKGLGVSEIHHAEAAAVSYPDFWEHIDKLAHKST
ncbi:3-phosphoshikimate 1-carboxyvinyltransferase, partial [Balneolaceae bacterium ANBcel3]|nr:3-phosphoshikimate 1-carboxyvinyltransferase [Balneolaceae bacterium ANBcel3]